MDMDDVIKEKLKRLELRYSVTKARVETGHSSLQERLAELDEVSLEYQIAEQFLIKMIDAHTAAFDELDKFKARHNLY